MILKKNVNSVILYVRLVRILNTIVQAAKIQKIENNFLILPAYANLDISKIKKKNAKVPFF